MKKYIIRLDDACDKMDTAKWNKMEALLDKYGIKPLVGVIPHCEDQTMDKYKTDSMFWDKVKVWKEKGWTIALHGYNHVYSTTCGGINSVHKRSEFAGEPLSIQKDKIQKGVAILRENGIDPLVFFAPSHTFDQNTIIALKEESNIRIISDTIANDSYSNFGMTFVPQQSGRARKLPFKTITFCYHPNSMTDIQFTKLESFLKKHHFNSFPLEIRTNKKTFFDKILQKIYLIMHR